MSFGRRLRTLRKNLSKTQQSLADDVGVSRIYIQALESDRRMPSMKLLHRLSNALEAPLHDLVSDSGNQGVRMQLEDLLSSGEAEIWFRKKKLTPNERRRVERVIQAILEDWDSPE